MEITVTDEASPALRRYLQRLSGARAGEELHRTIAFEMEHEMRKHLRVHYATKGNKLGAPSTGFWKRAIESTEVSASGVVGTLSIRERGVALRYYGGTVTAKRKKVLTIPIAAEAHGKRAGEIAGLFRVRDVLGRRIGKGETARFVPMFLLRKSTKHVADKAILPPEADMVKAAVSAAESYLGRVLA